VSRNKPGHPNGEQIVKVHCDEIRALGFMPRDVEVIGFVNPLKMTEMNQWVPESPQYCFLHIKSTVSFDRPDRSPLCIEELMAFYERYISVRRDWSSQLEQELSLWQQKQ
jgi:hypothetical protein